MIRPACLLLAALLPGVAAAAETPQEIAGDRLEERRMAGDLPSVNGRLVGPGGWGADGPLLPLVVVPAPSGAVVPGAHAWATYSMGVLVRASESEGRRAFVAELALADAGGATEADDRHLAALARAVGILTDEYPVDPARAVIVGEGDGAGLAWRLLARAPESYAAGVFIAGRLSPQVAERLAGTPLWIFQGEREGGEAIARTRAVVSAVWAAGGANARYTEIREPGPVWVPAWQENRLLPWLFSQSRE
ncbi:MAG: hypothetical protein ACOC6J_10080 [Spirochaetota bacterium]